MIKALRIFIFIWAVTGTLFGLGFILAPEQMDKMVGFEGAPAYVSYFLGLLGVIYVVTSVFVVIAARDPLKNIRWIQMAIAWTALDALIALYYIIRGNVTFSQAGFVIIIDIIFTIAFLVLYPRRKAVSANQTLPIKQ
jgi:multisubunit Na+/H+ antiporter MnhF subunit